MPPPPTWRTKLLTSSLTAVPEAAGIYAIGQEERVCGLEVKRTIVYIGKSLNLRQRLSQHTRFTETHEDLREYLRDVDTVVRIWYTTSLTRDELSAIEKRLIRELDPGYNRITYRTQ